MSETPAIIRSWRRATGLKQVSFAALLGVSQAAVSRWENGLDEPSPAIYAKIRALMEKQSRAYQRIEERIIEKMPGPRALVDLDGMRLLATTPTFKFIWPEMVAAQGQRLADQLVSLSRGLFHDDTITKAIRGGEIAMIAGVSDRHLNGFGDHSFRHYWSATYRKIGIRHYAEISFEACKPDAELGLRHVLRVDDIA